MLKVVAIFAHTEDFTFAAYVLHKSCLVGTYRL